MDLLGKLIDIFFACALFINAMLFIPQAAHMIIKKTSSGVSLVTFGGFLVIQFATILHGIKSQDHILVLGYVLSMLTCGSVVVLAVLYKLKENKIASN